MSGTPDTEGRRDARSDFNAPGMILLGAAGAAAGVGVSFALRAAGMT